MFSQQNIGYTLIGADTTATTQTRIENLESGKIAFTNKFGQILDNGGGATDIDSFDEVMIYQGGSNRHTDVITKDNVLYVKVEPYSAPTEQIDFIGYNGSSGTITAANETEYIVRLNFVTGERGLEFPLQRKPFAAYTSDASATAQEITTNLVEILAANARKLKEKDFKAEITSDGTPTQLASTDMIKLTKGSKTVAFYAGEGTATTGTVAAASVLAIPSSEGRTFSFTAANAITHIVYVGTTAYTVADAGSANANAAAIATAINADTNATGKYSADAGSAPTVTITYNQDFYMAPPVVYNDTGNDMIAVTIDSGNSVPVRYIVDTGASAAGSFTLTVAWQGETCFVSGDSTSGTNMFAATLATITNWGIKLTGIPRAFSAVKNLRYTKARWQTTLKNFGSTTVTESQASSLGNGAWKAVAEEDIFSDIVYGNQKRTDIWHPRNTYVTEGGKYGAVTICWVDEANTAYGPRPKTQKVVKIYFNDQAATNATTFLTLLGQFMDTSYSF
jgi:hypothetical protein